MCADTYTNTQFPALASRDNDARVQDADSVSEVDATSTPAPPPDPAQRPKDGEELSQRLRILLVEDHPDTLALMARLLRSLGYHPITATSVRTAPELAEREKFDLLISDIRLPDGSGLDVMRQIKARWAVKGIALTGMASDTDLQQTREAGFETHLTKPVDFQALEAIIQGQVRPRASG